MPILPMKLEEKDMDRCTVCDNMILKCVCGISKPLPILTNATPKPETDVVEFKPVVENPNLGFPICATCKDSSEYCIY